MLLYRRLLLTLAKVINFLYDVQECLRALGFIGDSLGGVVGWLEQALVVGAADDKQERIKFILWSEVQFANKWSQLFERSFFQLIQAATGPRHWRERYWRSRSGNG